MHLSGRRWPTVAAIGLAVFADAGVVRAQATQPAHADAAADSAAEEMVSLNLPDNAPLKLLLEYVSQEFGVNILYDEGAANQRVTIKAPAKLPKRAVPMLLDGALKMKGLALVDAEQPGWKQVVPLMQAARAPAPLEPGEVSDAAKGEATGTAVLTEVFPLVHADATATNTNIKPFLTTPGASSFAVPEQDLLVVTDYATNLARLAEVIRAIDRPTRDVEIQFLPVKHADAARLTQQVEQLLRARLRSAGGEGAAESVEVAFDARTNQLAVIVPADGVEDARQIVRALDVPVAEAQSPVRFYKLANATAADVLATIRDLEGGGDEFDDDARTFGAGGRDDRRDRLTRPGERGSRGSTYRNRGDAAEAAPARAPLNAAAANAGDQTPRAVPEPRMDAAAGATGAQRPVVVPESRVPGGSREGSSNGSGDPASPFDAVQAGLARVTADPHTNSIIVVAPPDVQRLYEQLIRQLDKRRPQVLIECTIVTLDTTGEFSLGVEIGRLGGTDDNKVVTFSSFGLSTPDPATGQLRLLPGLGFNGALVSTEVADVIVRALESNSRAKVSSAPRILVNDNSTGTLSSVNEFPYASVNASNTVATTSFNDYIQAGTEITVIPHISQSDYLQLEYAISLSSFTTASVQQDGVSLPPARKSDSVESQVTIPDGSTIIVGGLNSRDLQETLDAVPLLGRIPILKHLFSSRSTTDRNTTLFVFIRPVILRDDAFEDLKFLSARDLGAAEADGDFPESEPLAIP